MLGLVPLLALTACSSYQENSFTIDDENGVVKSAQLVLCGISTPFKRQGNRFTVARQINCEGSGYIMLTDMDDSQRQCAVGYVTVGARQEFAYSEEDCQLRIK